jgi:hypothetical protein
MLAIMYVKSLKKSIVKKMMKILIEKTMKIMNIQMKDHHLMKKKMNYITMILIIRDKRMVLKDMKMI